MKIFISFLFLLSLNSYPQQDKVVATVNGKNIMLSTFKDYYEKSLYYVSDKKITKQTVLDELITRELGIEKAKRNNLQNNSEVKSKMDDILYHAQISKDLEKKLNSIKVSDSEVRNYYLKNKEYRTAQILYRLRAIPSKAEVTQAFKAMLAIHQKVTENPDKFAEIANSTSQSSTAPIGGEMGFLPPNRLAPEYFEAINGKKIGNITKPIRTKFGFHIVKILGVKKFKDINVNVYRKIVYDQKRDQILADYGKSLMSKASIKINKDLL